MIDFLSYLRIGPKNGDFYIFTFWMAPFRPPILVNVLRMSLGPTEKPRGRLFSGTYFDEMEE